MRRKRAKAEQLCREADELEKKSENDLEEEKETEGMDEREDKAVVDGALAVRGGKNSL